MYEPLLNPSRSIRNKADAMQFAILSTMGENNKVDYDEAKKLFDFFCESVEFPEEDTKKMTELMVSLIDGFLSKNGD